MPDQWPKNFVKDCLFIQHPDQQLPMFAEDANQRIHVYLQDMVVMPLEQYETLIETIQTLKGNRGGIS